MLRMYVIPAGTSVSVLNLSTGERRDHYITRRQLAFIERSGTGYNGLILYFKYGQDWEICVHKDQLR